MANQIFTDAWLNLSSKEKKEQLTNKMLGLKLAVVYLDDEPEALEIFTSRCLELGLEAIVSTSSTELLNFISKNKSRVLMIVSDYRLPNESGFEFRQKVSGISSDIPFYILSGYVDRELALEGVKLKIAGFLDKPMHKETFIELLKGEGEKRAETIRDEYEMLKSFTDDVTNIVAEVEEGCLHLESDPKDSETVSRIFGLVHTVKGSSGFFEPRTLHLFAHAFEDIMKLVQAGQLQVTSGLISSWLKACDIIKTLNEELCTGEHKEYDIEALKSVLKVSSQIQEEAPEVDLHAKEVSGDRKSDSKDNRASDIKVAMSVLNEFTQVSGELTVIRNMINKTVIAIEKQYPGDKDVQSLSELLEEMHKINSDMQSKIADIRRVPASQLIKPLSRNFRDTSKALGKEVDFVVEGDDLRLDNAIADTLSRSLVHLMRNSLDHGLESNEERKNIGKPAKGRLLLKFESINESIVVTLEDDGRGINTDKIREKVINQGLRTMEEAKTMSDEELHLMIFEAGFSTAAQVTEFSGRGVGMSMVRETIEQQQGKIKIHSKRGEGCKFILEIPIPKSVLITNCLFVSVGKETIGIPQEFVVKVLDQRSLGMNAVEQLEGSQFIRFEGQLVPVISLAKTLNIKSLETEPLLVVLDTQGLLFALEVNQVLDAEDAVIKNLSFNMLKSIGVYQGGTFLADGTVGLVMDVPGLAKKLDLKKLSTKKKASEVVEEQTEMENIISFALFSHGQFAIPEKDVFRVEVISSDHMVRSGDSVVMPYRDSMMTLIHLDEVLFGKIIDNEEDLKSVIIIRHMSQYIGLVVKKIKDLEPVHMKVNAPLKKRPGVRGNLVYQEGSLTLIEPKEVISLLMTKKEDSLSDDINVRAA